MEQKIRDERNGITPTTNLELHSQRHNPDCCTLYSSTVQATSDWLLGQTRQTGGTTVDLNRRRRRGGEEKWNEKEPTILTKQANQPAKAQQLWPSRDFPGFHHHHHLLLTCCPLSPQSFSQSVSRAIVQVSAAERMHDRPNWTGSLGLEENVSWCLAPSREMVSIIFICWSVDGTWKLSGGIVPQKTTINTVK